MAHEDVKTGVGAEDRRFGDHQAAVGELEKDLGVHARPDPFGRVGQGQPDADLARLGVDDFGQGIDPGGHRFGREAGKFQLVRLSPADEVEIGLGQIADEPDRSRGSGVQPLGVEARLVELGLVLGHGRFQVAQLGRSVLHFLAGAGAVGQEVLQALEIRLFCFQLDVALEKGRIQTGELGRVEKDQPGRTGTGGPLDPGDDGGRGVEAERQGLVVRRRTFKQAGMGASGGEFDPGAVVPDLRFGFPGRLKRGRLSGGIFSASRDRAQAQDGRQDEA